MEKEWIGWHFLPENGKCRWGNHRKPQVDKTVAVKLPLSLCEHGLHASKDILDALKFAPGPILCKVRLSGKILEGDDKACATRRTVLAMADITNELHLFACWCATRALKKANVTDERCWNTIKVKRAWLKGKATDGELDVARGAARDAALVAAWDVARDAARVVAWDAARDVARVVAWDVAWVAARDAARVAARDAARVAARDAALVTEKKIQRKKLLSMIKDKV